MGKTGYTPPPTEKQPRKQPPKPPREHPPKQPPGLQPPELPKGPFSCECSHTERITIKALRFHRTSSTVSGKLDASIKVRKISCCCIASVSVFLSLRIRYQVGHYQQVGFVPAGVTDLGSPLIIRHYRWVWDRDRVEHEVRMEELTIPLDDCPSEWDSNDQRVVFDVPTPTSIPRHGRGARYQMHAYMRFNLRKKDITPCADCKGIGEFVKEMSRPKTVTGIPAPSIPARPPRP